MSLRLFDAIILTLMISALCGCGAPSRPADAMACYVKGVLLADENKPAAALEQFNLAVEAEPKLSVAHAAIGDVQFKRGKLLEARDAFESACRTNPHAFLPHYKLAFIYQMLADRAGEPAGAHELRLAAVGWYQKCLKLEPDDYDANINLCVLYFQMNQYTSAELYCREAIRIDPTSAGAHRNMGRIFEQQKRTHEAMRWYKASLELDQNQPDLRKVIKRQAS